MHPTSQIIEKNLHRRTQSVPEHPVRGLWINPERDTVWRDAAACCTALKLSCQEFGTYHFHQQAGAEVEFTAFPVEPKPVYQWIILTLPRQKALLHMLLDCAANLLTEDGTLWLAGENRAGIKSSNKVLTTYFGQVSKLDNARHCTLYEAKTPLRQHGFAAPSFRVKWPLECQHSKIQILSYPGVFAHGRLDDGTALLLDSLADMAITGKVLDFGCGAGVIGACIAASHKDSQVSFLDNSALALMSCVETLAANGLHGSILASDGLTQVSDHYDLVISNPPIHAGVKTENRLSVRLLENVHEYINPGGSLIMVANRHLPYERWLLQNFHRVSELASNDHFKLISALR